MRRVPMSDRRLVLELPWSWWLAGYVLPMVALLVILVVFWHDYLFAGVMLTIVAASSVYRAVLRRRWSG